MSRRIRIYTFERINDHQIQAIVKEYDQNDRENSIILSRGPPINVNIEDEPNAARSHFRCFSCGALITRENRFPHGRFPPICSACYQPGHERLPYDWKVNVVTQIMLHGRNGESKSRILQRLFNDVETTFPHAAVHEIEAMHRFIIRKVNTMVNRGIIETYE